MQEIAIYCEQKGIENNDLFKAIGYSLIQYDYESNNNINHIFELIFKSLIKEPVSQFRLNLIKALKKGMQLFLKDTNISIDKKNNHNL